MIAMVSGSSSPPPSAAAFGPVGERERILTLDVLRGFALLGVLMVNMQFFAMPFGKMVGGEALATGPAAEQLAWGVVHTLFAYKFISLFSLMFGMGLVVALMRAEAAGRPFVPVYLRRLAVLALIGLAHALLLWYGDILFIYAVLGVVLLFCRRLSPKVLLWAGGLLIALSVVLNLGLSGLMVLGETVQRWEAEARAVAEEPEARAEVAQEGTPEPAPEAERADPAKPPRGLRAMGAANFDPFDPVWMEAEERAYGDGPFVEAFLFRALTFLYALFGAAFSFGWRVLGLFLIGAALMKLRFFSAEQRGWHRRLVVWGLAIGLPIELLSALVIHAGGHEINLHFVAGYLLHDVGSVALTFAYAGLVALAVAAGVLPALARGLAAVGRMALTNYLLQTLVATGIMYWWGLGWFGQVGRPAQLALVVVLFAAQILLSTLWLRAFRFGPMEWLWRTLTYGRRQPLLRTGEVAPG